MRLLLLILTTIRRLVLVLLVFLAWTPAAYAWSWPVQGPLLKPFSFDEAHPYAAGQHRGVDIGAGAAGQVVVAPAAGTVSFAGTVPTNGKTVTIETADGYSVTLTHLGSIGVTKGTQVAEQGAIGTVGPSGTPEEDGPYVHLGIRVTADPNGYLDPLGFLPAPTESAPAESTTTPAQPASQAASSTPRASKPAARAPARPPRVSKHESSTRADRGDVSVSDDRRTNRSRAETRPTRSAHPVVEHEERVRERAAAQPRQWRRPVVETLALGESTRLDAGHEIRPSTPVAAPHRRPSIPLPTLLCNWAAAFFALGAALAAHRRRRCPDKGAQVLRLPPTALAPPHASRAA